MKLVNRLLFYFLSALAVVLVVYSSVFYAFVRTRLAQQFEQELRGALSSLVAAVEVEPEDVSWQPLEHEISARSGDGLNAVQWVVIGDGDRLVEQSVNAGAELVEQARGLAARRDDRANDGQLVASGDWRLLSQRLAAPAPDDSQRDTDEFDEIVLVVAQSAAPLHADLSRLLLLVTALPIATWLAAAAAGRWLCRRALYPVLHMSAQARSMIGDSFEARLPTIETGDELAELAAAFNTLLDHRHRAFEQQRRFASDAAHELRTPLTVLLGQAEVALRRTRSPQEYADTLQLLRDQAVQLRTIVESLLYLARAEDDATLPGRETISLEDWLPDYMDRWHEHPRRDDLHLQISSIRNSWVEASPALLARLLDNLVENAIKYSSPGSSVEVNLSADDAGVLVEVQDHGAGIAPDDLGQVFRPFFRSRAARAGGIVGTGLGLAIASRIAAACGGTLDCASSVGQGSRFTLRLPVASGQRSPQSSDTPATSAAPPR